MDVVSTRAGIDFIDQLVFVHRVEACTGRRGRDRYHALTLAGCRKCQQEPERKGSEDRFDVHDDLLLM